MCEKDLKEGDMRKGEESMDKHKRPMNQKSLLFETLYVLKKGST